MIKIAICDDEEFICRQVRELTALHLDDSQYQYEIDLFTSGQDLCAALKTTDYNIVFLDIELPDINGIKIGSFIRNILDNEQTSIIYISAKTTYALELFKNRPLNFLVKPLTPESIASVFTQYFKVTEQTNHFFSYTKESTVYKIPIRDILYFEKEKQGKRIIVHMRNCEPDAFYSTIENIHNELKCLKFLFINQSTLVNYRSIQKYNYLELELHNGVILPISRTRRKIIRKLYLDYSMEDLT